MGTRSYIGFEKENGQVVVAYCHWDGYPEHNGAILVNYYNDPKKVKRLVMNGNMSVLGCHVGAYHPFEDPGETNEHGFYIQTTYYGRDRGEVGQGPITFRNMDDVLEDVRNDAFIEYLYIYTNRGWLMWEAREPIPQIAGEPAEEGRLISINPAEYLFDEQPTIEEQVS